MRRTAWPRMTWVVGLGCASIALSSLCGCSWEEVFPRQAPTLSNAVAVDRALRLCSLPQGDQPFHLILDIVPPLRPPALASGTPARPSDPRSQKERAQAQRAEDLQSLDMRAQIEIYWLNAVTYRTIIRSRSFSQVRIVNGRVIEEHNTGDFYPRWIQNFVDAILEPIPKVEQLRKVPGTIPIGLQAHACVSNRPSSDGGSDATATSSDADLDETAIAQVCFQDAEPRLASGGDFTRSIWFDNFSKFGDQLIARSIVNELPANLLVHGQISLLEPLRQTDYPLVKAKEFTLPDKQIQTAMVSKATAQSLLESTPEILSFAAPTPARKSKWKPATPSTEAAAPLPAPATAPDPSTQPFVSKMTLYIRTDRSGKVREVYRDPADLSGLQNAAVARALTLKFKPLIVNGAPVQIEAPITVP